MFDRRILENLGGARAALSGAVAAGLAGAALTVVQAWLIARIVGGAFLRHEPPDALLPRLALLALAALARAAAGMAGQAASARVAERVKVRLRGRLQRHLLALGPAAAAGERSGELAAALTQGVESLEAYLAHYLPQVFLAALVPLALLAAAIPRDGLSALIMALTAPAIPVFMALIGARASARAQRQWAALGRMSAHFLDVLQGLTTLRILGRSRDEIARIERVSEEFRGATMSVLRIAFLSSFALELLATLGTALIAVTIGLRLLKGGIAFEPALMVLVLAPEFYLPLRTLGARFHAGIEGLASARRIFELLERPAPSDTPAVSPPAVVPPVSAGPPEIAFEDVRFAYDARARPALCGATFRLAPGAVTALVGPSGAGKSTAARLLLRFVDPQHGRVAVRWPGDGRPGSMIEGRPAETSWAGLDAMTAADWRRLVSWVPQRPHLFHGTLADNLRLARPDAPDERLREAAAAAGLLDYIESLPRGWDTEAGERGLRLSGGQAQRLAIARALLKDAPVLVLDEPTSFLDAEMEEQVRAAIERLAAGRTTLMIAHRLPTVRRASQVVVMQEGRVVEAGAPAELEARGGAFAGMLRAARGVGS